MLHLGAANNGLLDELCAFLIVISPILQHYVGLYKNLGFTVLIVTVPLMMLNAIPLIEKNIRLPFGKSFRLRIGKEVRMPLDRTLKMIYCIAPLLLFLIYSGLIHGKISRMMYSAFMIVIFLLIANGNMNSGYFLKWAIRVCYLATAVLVVQYISYYVFHYRLDIRPLDLLVDQDSIWIEHAKTYTTTGMYRSGGFFLEPSHFFVYSFPVLTMLLLSPEQTKYRRISAIVISIGLLLTTSGFGIVFTVAIWGLYLVLYRNCARGENPLRKLLRPRTFIILGIIIAVFVVAYFAVPVFHSSVNRIFVGTNGQSSAIDGRIKLAKKYISQISGINILFGEAGVVSSIEFNLAGFFATYIKYGVIGVALSYWFYCQGIFKLRREYLWMSLFIVVISFFTAHTHGTFYMLYYVIFLMNGYYDRILTDGNRGLLRKINVKKN